MIMIRHTHGLTSAPQADPEAPGGIAWKSARYSVGIVDPGREPDDRLDLLTEFLSGAPVAPWACSEDRDAALRFLPTASWVAPGIREKLVDHVRRMPWLERRDDPPKRKKPRPGKGSLVIEFEIDSGFGCSLYDLPDSESRSGHVWLPARWSPGNWEEVPGGILDEMKRGTGAIPWLSARHRQRTLERLSHDGWGYSSHGGEVVKSLIRHVERTPYWLGDDNADYLKSLTGPDALS